jgi:flagellar biosynthesis protein FlhB
MDETGGRQVPPSEARLAAAARAGLFPRSRLLVTGSVLLGAGSAGYLARERIGAALRGILADGLASALARRGDPGMALADGIVVGFRALLPLLLAGALAGVVAALVPALAARRGRGSTAVRFPRRAARSRTGVLAIAGVGLLALLALWLLRAYGGEAAQAARGEEVGVGWIGELMAALVFGAGAIAFVLGLAELALARARLLGELALTPSEARREERAASGDRRVKERARTWARRDDGAP